MRYKVCKFGGTSLATRGQLEKVLDLVLQNLSRRFVVLSAPGKKDANDTKITNLLIRAISEYPRDKSSRDAVKQRFREIGYDVPEVVEELSQELDKRLAQRDASNYADIVKAFGEYACARIVTEVVKKRGIEARFMDPLNIGLKINNHNTVPQPNPSCYETIGKKLLDINGEVPITFIPGYYGYSEDGLLITLPRNGTDVTGAVIANAVNASVYENWTDEDGLRRADPRIVGDAELIQEMTYTEARELASKGFKLQEDSLIPLIGKYIPMNVRNTNNSTFPGSWVVHDRIVDPKESIVGVSCKPGYVAINIKKVAMNKELGFARRVFQVLEDEKINFEHDPTGNDNMSIIVEGSQLGGVGKVNGLFRQINETAGPLEISLGREPLSLVAVAGLGMRQYRDAPARVLYSLKNKGIYPRTMNMGASDISFFMGVNEEQGEDAVKAIYQEFF